MTHTTLTIEKIQSQSSGESFFAIRTPEGLFTLGKTKKPLEKLLSKATAGDTSVFSIQQMIDIAESEDGKNRLMRALS